MIGEMNTLRAQLATFDPFGQMDEGQAALRQALSGQAPRLSPEERQSYFQNSVAAPLLRAFDTQIAPRIDEAFANLGATFSTARGQAKRGALRDLQTQMTGELSRMALQDRDTQFQADNQALQRQLQAVPLAQQQSTQGIQNALAKLGALDPFQQREQAMLDTQYQEFLRTAPENNPYLQMALGYGTAQTQENIVTQDSGWMDAVFAGQQFLANNAQIAASLMGGGGKGMGA